jgi:hypothetical protein
MTFLLAVLLTSSGHPCGAEEAHDREFWRAIVASEYAFPEGESEVELLAELSSFLASPDPELRDEFGYGITARWIYRDKLYSPDELRVVLDEWSGNLSRGLGDVDTDSVFVRSFSALDLSILAAYDNLEPFLTREEFSALLAAAVDYFRAERDLRGYDDAKGWVHPLNHTADLLRFLGRSRHLEPPEQAALLEALASRTTLPDAAVYAWGEGERFARVVLSLIGREDFDRAAFDAWIDSLTDAAEGLWQGPLDREQYARVENTKQLLGSLFVLLSALEERSEQASAARESVLAALGSM